MMSIALALLLLGSAGAVSAAEITVKTPAGPVPAGETVVVPVVVAGAEKLDACDIRITADASDVTIVANTTNPVDGTVLTVNTVDNVAKISFYHLTGVTGDLTLCYVDCVPKKSGASAPVNLTIECIAENGSAGTPGDAVYAKYAVVNGSLTTERDPSVVTTLEIKPTTVSTLFPGDTRQFAATVYDQYGDPMNTPVAWSSSNTTVGTVDASTGLFTVVCAGTTGITARAGGVMSGAVMITVRAVPAPARIEVASPALVSPLNTTQTVQFTATVYDQYNSVMEIPLAWSSSNPTVGTIDASTGLFTALCGGTTNVTAVAGEMVSENVMVTVYLAPVSVPPAPKSPVNPQVRSDAASAVLKIVVDRQDVDGDAWFNATTVNPAGGEIPTFGAGMGLPEDAYLALNITPEHLKDEKHLQYSAVLTFRIPVADLPASEKHNVRAYRYNTLSDAWEALPTAWMKTEAGYHHYEVKTSGFSVFTMVRTIGGAPAVTPPTPPPTPTPKPGHSGGGSSGGHGGNSGVKMPVSVPTQVAPGSESLAANETVIPTQAPATVVPTVSEAVQTAVSTSATPTGPAPSPGFGVVAALAGASAAFVLAGRRD
ncbi:Ig-like domain-containing protein [Methanofollis aquaemaris]|nr:Ig-like domain-containing protein [Methanofollis aquaemaris]